MHSPSSTADLFLSSSPPRYTGKGPEEEVEVLLASAQMADTLNDNLIESINKNKSIFLEVFGRQVQLIRSRSQAFEDAHVTVYDKVLLLLTNNGNNLEAPAAIAWYCTEYLGINPHDTAQHNDRVLEKALTVPVTLYRAAQTIPFRPLPQVKPIPALTPSPSRKNSDLNAFVDDDIGDEVLKHSSIRADPKFSHLWSIYRKANADYLAVAHKRDSDTLKAARFLRDTAENGIYYLQDKYPKDPALIDMTTTFNKAKSAVISLNGGRKRKFDTIVDEGKQDYRSYPPHTIAHDRVNATRRRNEHDYDHDHLKKKPRGRGPSGVPYGYTRPVDSYYPHPPDIRQY